MRKNLRPPGDADAGVLNNQLVQLERKEDMKDTNRESHSIDLNLVSPDKRTFSTVSFVLMYWSSVIVIQGFVLGQSMLPPNGSLNIGQALTALLIAALLLAAFFALNGMVGNKYGIPYVVQVRSSFGMKGSKIAILFRNVPAIFWLGIATWIGASAISAVTNMLFGFGNVYVYFIIILVVQAALAAAGIQSIKWFETTMAIVIVVILVYMMISISQNFNEQLTANWSSKGSWGMPFITSVVALVGAVITVSVNSSDLARYLVVGKKQVWIGHLLGIPLPKIFLVVLGIISGAALGIWDPVEALIQVSPNKWSAVLVLILITLAQITTNLTSNILPPALMLMDFFKKLSWQGSVVIVSVLGIASCPWILFTHAGFFGLINAYSAFLGPVLAVMLADFYFIRKQKLDAAQLYEPGCGPLYRFTKGWNIAALAAVAVGGVFGILFNSLSWLVAGPIAFVVYLILYPVIYGKNKQFPDESVTLE